MTYNVSNPAKWMPFFIILFVSGNMNVECTVCSDMAKYVSIPVARFCTNDTVFGLPVVLDGFYADSLHDITTCKCVAHTTKQNVTFQFENAYNVSPIQNLIDCGSTVTFEQPKVKQMSESCSIDGAITIDTVHGNLDMYLTRDTTNGNRSYCFKLYVDNGYILSVSCVNAISESSVTPTSPTTSDAPVLLTSEITSFSSTLEENEDLVSTTETINTISSLPNSSILDTSKESNENNPEILFIVIGCVVVLVCGFVVGIILFLKFRKNSKETQTTYDDLNVADINSTSHYNSLSVLTDTITEKHQYENSQTNPNIIANDCVDNSYYEMSFTYTTQTTSNVSKVRNYVNQNELK